MAERKLIVNEQPKSAAAEAYRTLRTNLQYAKVDGELKTIMYTSAGPSEGKSTTIANTAVVLATQVKKSSWWIVISANRSCIKFLTRKTKASRIS